MMLTCRRPFQSRVMPLWASRNSCSRPGLTRKRTALNAVMVELPLAGGNSFSIFGRGAEGGRAVSEDRNCDRFSEVLRDSLLFGQPYPASPPKQKGTYRDTDLQEQWTVGRLVKACSQKH